MLRSVTRLGSGLLALAAAGTLASCGSEREAQSQPQEEGVMLAKATAPVVGENIAPVVETKSPRHVTYGEAESVFRKGRYPEAAELFGLYVASHPQNGWGHYMLGLSAWKSGDRGRAEQALIRAVELDSTNVKMRINLGRVLLEQGRPQDALPHLERAVDIAPHSYEVWRVLGNLQAELGRSEEALTSYREAIAINEKDSWSMNNYGLVLIKLGRYEEALAPLARAVELVPTSPVFQNNLGIAFERSDQLGGARIAFSAAVAADSTYVKAQVSLERVLSRLGGADGDTPDLGALARSFEEQIQMWRNPVPPES